MTSPLHRAPTLRYPRTLLVHAHVCRALGLHKDAQALLEEACEAVRNFVARAADRLAACAEIAPPALAGDESLVAAWRSAIFELRAARKRRRYLESLPSADELLDLLQVKPQEVDQHTLSLDRESDVIWITNPYGIDSALLEATVPALERFLAAIKAGAIYGPQP